jgi:hypothetical protein
MSMPAGARKPPRVVALAAAPVTCLEHLRGWKRRALLGAYAVVLTLAAAVGWWATSLRGLPDIGEPFDVRTHAHVYVPDDRNAFVIYREAARRLKHVDQATFMRFGHLWGITDWSRAVPALRDWAAQNRGALETWLPGTERPEALNIQPAERRIESRFWPEQDLEALVQLALLEGSRRERAGDLPGAWTMYRAALRCTRHIGMHGPATSRVIGFGALGETSPHIRRWVQHSAITPELLREARRDLDACIAMTPRVSEAIRGEYFALDAALCVPKQWARYGLEDQSLWYSSHPSLVRAARFLRREPERSRRVLRLLFAGILAQCDRPRDERAGTVEDWCPIYEVDAATPPAVRAIRPEKLRDWHHDSTLRGLFPGFGPFLRQCESDVEILEELRIRIAARHYALDHGKPAATYGDLLGSYLASLPKDVRVQDSIP